MCGIAGVVAFDGRPVAGTELEAMTATLAHRGPDGTGVLIRENVGIGHRRLAVIDPAGGAQPMVDDAHGLWISYNGEIYNFQELRSELERLGHRFVTRSDTEVLLKAYAQWGADCVHRLRGMFAFTIVDWKERELFLARDHFGIKPLYYSVTDGGLAFASEVQAVLRAPGVRTEIDLEAVDRYLCLQYVPVPQTAFASIRKLAPGHTIRVPLDGGPMRARRYWRPGFEPDQSLSEDEWIERVDDALSDSVRAHLVADVPFGVFLSGGVDSSLVLSHMSRLLDEPVHAFTIGFHESGFDEVGFAKTAVQACGAVSEFRYVDASALDLVPRLVRHYGDLFGDSSAVPSYLVSEFASARYKMVLSGDGADEMFAGYWSYMDWMAAEDHEDSQPPDHRLWLRLVSQMRHPQRRGLWRRELRERLPDLEDLFAADFEATTAFTHCNRAQYTDLNSYLPNVILNKVDVASMMHGLEVRTPFVDVRLFEQVSRIPERLNVRRSDSGEWLGKCLLKKVAERHFPRDFVHRPKMGFAVPLENWLLGNDRSRRALIERLCGPESRLPDYFEPEAVRQLAKTRSARPLWLLLILDEWLAQAFEAG